MIKVVFLKELREMLRDRRVIFGAFVMPVLVIFLMMRLFSVIGSSVEGKKATKIAVVQTESGKTLADGLTKSTLFEIQSVATAEEAKALLEKSKVKVALNIMDKPNDAGQLDVRAMYLGDENLSMIALSRLREVIEQTNKVATQTVLQAQGISAEQAEPVKLTPEDVSSAKKGALDSMMVSMLPYLMILFMFAGGMSIASDLVAGEKERQTLETLLVAPVKRIHIAAGKLGAMSIFCVLTGASSVFALALISITDKTGGKMMFGSGVGLGVLELAQILMLLFSLALLFAGLLLAISSWAKNMREAQTYMAVANFFVIMPAVFSQIIGFTEAGQQLWVRLVPVLNVAVAFREILLGKNALNGVLIATGMNLILAAALLLMANRLFNDERILART